MRALLKVFKYIIIVILAIVLFFGVINLLPFAPMSYKKDNHFRVKKSDYPFNIPHGGAKLEAPENTIYSYERLDDADYPIKILEIDLTLTKDGEYLITHHDLELGFGDLSPIKDLTYQEIKDRYEDDDYSLARDFYQENELPLPNEQDLKKMIPADLDKDVFEKFESNDYLYILEIKDVPLKDEDDPNYQESLLWSYKASDKLINLIKKHNLEDKVVLSSFSDTVINYFRKQFPEGITNLGVSETTNFSIYTSLFIDFFWKTKGQVLIIPNVDSYGDPLDEATVKLLQKLPKFITSVMVEKDAEGNYRPNLANKTIIDAAHRKNIAVFFWTINDPEEMKELIELGVDGIITDYPEMLNDIINGLKGEVE